MTAPPFSHVEREAWIATELGRATSSWSIGAPGAVAEFHHRGEAAVEGLQTRTRWGGIRVSLPLQARPLAYEILSSRPGRWHHGVAFCLASPLAHMGMRGTITELGPDREALRSQDRKALLFDLGLGLETCDFCVRTADAELIAALRAARHSRLLEQPAMMSRLMADSPHRVMISRLARIEVYGKIAAEGDYTPAGPHTQLLPHRLRSPDPARHIPLPSGFLSCLTLHPEHPRVDRSGRTKKFHASAHQAFQRLLERYGDPEYVAAKRLVIDAVRAGKKPGAFAAGSRLRRTACRVTLRQLQAMDGPSPTLDAWLRFRDAPEADADQ